MLKTILNKIRNRLLNNDNRTNKMRKNVIAMFVVRGLSILISLANVPIILHAVDRTEYGILLTLTSMVHWISMFDIGLGSGLRNKISYSIAHDKKDLIKLYTSSSYALLAVIVLVILVLFAFSAPFISWQGVLNAPETSEEQLRNLVIIVFFAFCMQFLLNLINSILYAYQLPAFNSFFQLIGQALSFILVCIFIYQLHITDILTIGSITCFVTPLVLAIATIILFKTKLKEAKPEFRSVKFSAAKSIMNLGLKFFVLQTITLILFNMNNFIIAQVVDPKAVVEYNIAFKYIAIISMIYTIIVTPVWSASADAYARNDYAWIKRTINNLQKISLFVAIGGLIMVFISKFIYKFWLHEGTIEISYFTTFLVYTSAIALIYYQNYGYIINGTNRVFAQIVITGAIAILYIPCTIFLGKIFGLTGVLLSNTIVQTLNYLWSKVQLKKILAKPNDYKSNNFWLR